jgi:hypothetical protein
MFDSVQRLLDQPVPYWMLIIVAALLWHRNYVQTKAIAMLNEAITRAIPGIWKSTKD